MPVDNVEADQQLGGSADSIWAHTAVATIPTPAYLGATSTTGEKADRGSRISKEENSRLAARQIKFIRDLENALIRIENKTYGICRQTGNLISKERLRSVPHATLSIEAKLNQSAK